MPSPSVEIRIENLSKSFGSRHVLNGIDLEVRSGEMLAIVGGSGNGKSTLLRQIIGLDHPDQGRVLVADHESKDSPLVDLAILNTAGMESLERHWAVVFQGNALLSGHTVGFNIGLPLREVQNLDEPTVRRKVQGVLREVALDPDEDLALTTDQLSGGMAKRVAIARALALDPILLLYDEPTTGLDPQVAEKIQDLIGSVHRGKTASGFARTTLIITYFSACSRASSCWMRAGLFSMARTTISAVRIPQLSGPTLTGCQNSSSASAVPLTRHQPKYLRDYYL
jgi:phospholipid/cholesterol/gamma-HCH transport system ATP-binding protein